MSPNDTTDPKRNACPHDEFDALVSVNRITDMLRWSADIQVRCKRCGRRFRFMGLPQGLHPRNPTMGVFGYEARLPIEPLPLDSPRAFDPLVPTIVTKKGEGG